MKYYNSKICTRCWKPKPIDMFGKNKNTKDGRQYWCRICMKEYMDERKKR